MATRAALWTQHRRLALGIAHEYRLPGADRDDVQQEALIALWVATGLWDSEKGAFPAFARLVVRRRLSTLLRAALAAKHEPLTRSLRYTRDADGVEEAVIDTLSDGHDTETVVVARETLERVVAAVAALSEKQRSAIALLLNGEPVTADKSVDNALWRARGKLREAAR